MWRQEGDGPGPELRKKVNISKFAGKVGNVLATSGGKGQQNTT